MNRKIGQLLLCTAVLVAGCQMPPQPESEYERVSREIEQMQAQADAAAAGMGNIRVEIRMLSVSDENYFAVQGLFRYADENVVIAARPAAFNRSGLRIGAAGENFRAQVRMIAEQLRTSEETEMFLVLADGASGYLFAGRQIAVPRFYVANRWYTSVGYDFVRAGRGFDVTARTLGPDLIEMTLTPVFSDFLNDGGDLRLVELSTTVRLRSGRTVIIGRSSMNDEDVSRALLSYARQGRRMQMLITVTPTLQ